MGDLPRWLISHQQLNSWLDELARSNTLLAPCQVEDMLLYQRVTKSEEISRQSGKTVLSIKEAFFPPSERLFMIGKHEGRICLDETQPPGPTVIYGVRPCEARGIRLLDDLFIDTPPVDRYYTRRRENTLLIGLACQEMGPTCFCTAVGGAPDDAGDVDIMLFAVDGAYLVQAVTDKGENLIPRGAWKTTTIEPQKLQINSQYVIPSPQSIPWEEHFKDTYWSSISESCLSCRACAYVCPTCRCFAVRDEMISPGTFERIRCWESCASENYRRVAGGKRARPEKGERLRNRFYCKFYYYPEQTGKPGTSACVGCGRCVDVCPVGVDITEVIQDLRRLA